MNVIEVKDLVKEYKLVKKDKGLKGSLKSLVKPEKTIFRAVDNISFDIGKGEIVAYIGPNGAGKSTTVKMMSGILTPTSGSILINGLSPQQDRKKVVLDLGVVFGQRSQLNWDLRLGESFELLKHIYRIDDQKYKDNYAIMNDILEIDKFINTPVRQLSLGQRMRGDLAAAMLHSPSVLFLDEPTIGLDVEGKYAIRKFIKDINEARKTSIILTTHDLGDVKELCDRLIIINKGHIIEDGSYDALRDKIAPYRQLVVEFYDEAEVQVDGAEIVAHTGNKVVYQFDKKVMTAAAVMSAISAKKTIKDIAIEEAKIDDVIRIAYNG